MEVHHHSSMPHKKWTHYFWEFLMLFLAVTLGFFVENQREHYVEHQREKQFAQTLYEDIIRDTTALKNNILDIDFVTHRIDTFRYLVQHFEIKDLPGGTWYYYGRFGTRNFQVTFQDATIQQLKNSGGLRYFRKASVANAIAHYDQSCRFLVEDLSLQTPIYNDLVKLRNNLFNTWYLDEIMELTVPLNQVEAFKKKNIPLLSEQKKDFIQYANLCQLRAYNNTYSLDNMKQVLKQGEELLELLKKVYHLK
jgi:hypothetical protein